MSANKMTLSVARIFLMLAVAAAGITIGSLLIVRYGHGFGSTASMVVVFGLGIAGGVVALNREL
jgi:CHASE2 domain-containing sensor protein